MRREIARLADVESLAGQWEIPRGESEIEHIAEPDLLKQPLNDYGNGQRLIAAQGERLRYWPAFRT